MLVPIDEVVHFDVTTHIASTGAVSDADSTPTFAVYEEDTDTAIVTGNLTKRTALTGNYRGTFTASAANGFEAGKWYDVIVSATVSSVAAKAVAMHFRVAVAEATAGLPKVDSFTTAMTEAYAADGAAPTLAQAIFMIWSFLAERSVSATTMTCKKLDGSTTSMTFTLNNAVQPTSVTRAS